MKKLSGLKAFGLVRIYQDTLSAISFGKLMMKLILPLNQLIISVLKPKRQASTCLF
jgi:hypothetical protein